MDTYLQSFVNQVKELGFPKLDLSQCLDEAYMGMLKAKHPSNGKVAIEIRPFTESVEFKFYGHEDNILRWVSVYNFGSAFKIVTRKLNVEQDEATRQYDKVTETFDSVDEALMGMMAILVLDGRVLPPFKSQNH